MLLLLLGTLLSCNSGNYSLLWSSFSILPAAAGQKRKQEWQKLLCNGNTLITAFKTPCVHIVYIWLVGWIIRTSGEVSLSILYLETVGRPCNFKKQPCVGRALAHFMCCNILCW